MPRPNVVFFFTDDQRFDTIQALGNPEIHTPHIDSLVRNGTTFTNGYIMGGTSGAVCMPSRAMLMSGRTLFHLEGQGQSIPAEHAMLPETLRQAGYDTFGTGKWHNGAGAYARCFTHGGQIFFGGMHDHWNVPACDFDPSGRYPEPRELQARFGEVRWNGRAKFDHIEPGRHSSELFGDATCDFLQKHEGDKPFFAYCSFMAPHDPRETYKRYHDMYAPEEIRLPENYMPEHPFDNGEMTIRDEKLAPWPRTPEEVRRHIAEYYAMITHADAAVGRVLATLESTGHAEGTIVVFAGDNGLAVGRHGLMGKQSLYDHSVHVPLIMSGPGVPKGEKRDALCYLLDIFPTLCDLTGVPVPGSVEGKSLVPAMRDPDEKIREALLFAYTKLHRGAMDGDGKKLIEYVVNGERTTQLFDLQSDPWELHNLADDPASADDLARLRAELLRWREELDDTQDFGAEFWGGYCAGG